MPSFCRANLQKVAGHLYSSNLADIASRLPRGPFLGRACLVIFQNMGEEVRCRNPRKISGCSKLKIREEYVLPKIQDHLDHPLEKTIPRKMPLQPRRPPNSSPHPDLIRTWFRPRNGDFRSKSGRGGRCLELVAARGVGSAELDFRMPFERGCCRSSGYGKESRTPGLAANMWLALAAGNLTQEEEPPLETQYVKLLAPPTHLEVKDGGQAKQEHGWGKGMGNQHPSPNVKTLCNFETQIWLEIITSRDAKSACFQGSRTSCREITVGILGANFGQKRSHHVMDVFLLRVDGRGGKKGEWSGKVKWKWQRKRSRKERRGIVGHDFVTFGSARNWWSIESLTLLQRSQLEDAEGKGVSETKTTRHQKRRRQSTPPQRRKW